MSKDDPRDARGRFLPLRKPRREPLPGDDLAPPWAGRLAWLVAFIMVIVGFVLAVFHPWITHP